MKRYAKVFSSFALLILLIVPVLAIPVGAVGDFPVRDSAELLSVDQQAELQARAQSLAEQYHCGVYICTVDAMENGTDADAAMDSAKQVYKQDDLGVGEEKSGMLLFLSMETRKYALIAYGGGNTVLTDYGREKMLENYILPELADNNWYDAFSAYLDRAEVYLRMADEGEPYDVNNDPDKKPSAVLLAAIFGVLPAGVTGIFCGANYSKLKNAKIQHDADYYIPEGGANITFQDDRFLYEDEVRVYDPPDDHDSGGTSVGSDGFSGSSGSF